MPLNTEDWCWLLAELRLYELLRSPQLLLCRMCDMNVDRSLLGAASLILWLDWWLKASPNLSMRGLMVGGLESLDDGVL